MGVFDRIKQRVGNQEDFDVNKAIEEVKARRAADEAKQHDYFKRQFEEAQSKESIGRSGILPLHQRCTVNNFEASTSEQSFAKSFAAGYVNGFSENIGQGFIFSGTQGTGKNHLAAAICNELMRRNKSCLIITISELMIKLRNCYNKGSETTEDKFIQSMIAFDLLVLDEVGLQRGTDNEKLVINQIIDQRVCRMKPTGMLTNLNAEEINDVLGIRIMDRMRMNGGKWIPFHWNSYRK